MVWNGPGPVVHRYSELTSRRRCAIVIACGIADGRRRGDLGLDVARRRGVGVLVAVRRRSHVALAVKRVDESRVVDVPQMMQVPQFHWIDLLGILVLPDRLFVD